MKLSFSFVFVCLEIAVHKFPLPPGTAAQREPWPPHSRVYLITHNHASQSVGLLWTSDQLVAETST